MPAGIKKVFATKLTDVNTSAKEELGTLRFEGGSLYKYVMFKNTTATVALAAGDGVAYDAEDGHINSHVVTDLSDAGSKPVCAGVGVSAAAGTLATAYYLWILVKGPVTLSTAIAASIDGTPVACGDGDPIALTIGTDKTFRRQNTVVDADAEVLHTVGLAIDASAKYVVLDCPF